MDAISLSMAGLYPVAKTNSMWKLISMGRDVILFLWGWLVVIPGALFLVPVTP